MDYLNKILVDFEIHSPEGIQDCFDHSIDPNQIHEGKPLVYSMINMYARGSRFKECLQVFVTNGLIFDDKILLSVLLDDSENVDILLSQFPQSLNKKYSLDCTFTPLYEASLLHICAEYNHLASAKILVKHGIDINTRADVDENGFGGHTPVFHTVNQNQNRCIDMLKYLVSQHADLSITVKGLIWGKGYDWETFIPSVNPISYSMMGLLRQFQRTEAQIYEVVNILMIEKYSIDYMPGNIPNKYLNS